MAIDYILDYGCQPKRVLGLGGVLDGAKLREHAARLKQMQDEGQLRPDEIIQIVRFTAAGTLQEERLTTQELLAKASGYSTYAGHCRGCPASVLERCHGHEHLFGCHGTVEYPLTDSFEFLLWVTLRFVGERMMDQPASRLIHFILETGIDGESARSARDQRPPEGPRFTERDQALGHVVTAPSGQVPVDTDQLLEALFFGGKIEPQVASFMLVPFFETMEKVIEIVANEKGLPATERLKDRGAIQLREFGRAVAIAAELNSGILIDH